MGAVVMFVLVSVIAVVGSSFFLVYNRKEQRRSQEQVGA